MASTENDEFCFRVSVCTEDRTTAVFHARTEQLGRRWAAAYAAKHGPQAHTTISIVLVSDRYSSLNHILKACDEWAQTYL